MINLKYEPAPNVRFAIGKYAGDVIELMGIGAAELLQGRLDVHETSGVHWTKYGMPRQSSAPGEYPQRQFGNLYESIRAVRIDETKMRVGFFDGGPAIGRIEFNDESEGGRAPLRMHFEDDFDETQEFMKLRAEGSR